jgi:hypothetical protein
MKVTIETENAICEISEPNTIMLDDVIDMCRRAINGVGFHCKELVQEMEDD